MLEESISREKYMCLYTTINHLYYEYTISIISHCGKDSGRDGKCMLRNGVPAGFNVNNVSSRYVCLCIFGNETQN